MAYSKTTWANGDTITAEKLNNLENGVEAADASASRLPAVTSDDNGDLLGVSGGVWAKVAPGAQLMFEAIGTLSMADTKKVMTLNKTAGELYAAVSAGQLVKVTTAVSESVTVEMIFAVTAQKTTDEGVGTVYNFLAFVVDGTQYISQGLSDASAVVITEQ